MLAFCAMGFCGLVFFWIKTRPIRNRRRSYTVSTIESVGEDAICLEIFSNTKQMPIYMPGQFSFFTFFSTQISREEHPFSLTSTPSRTSCFQFVVRTTGDWTSKLKKLQPGDRVLMNGPFGLFSHLLFTEINEIIMIAGGIGITPMLSMLRYMADCKDQRKITLIWSNQTRKHIIFLHEFQNLTAQLNGLRIFHVLTRDSKFSGDKGRLDQPKLKKFLSDCSRSSAIFICGPNRMMKEIHHCLVSLQFPRRLICMERFSL